MRNEEVALSVLKDNRILHRKNLKYSKITTGKVNVKTDYMSYFHPLTISIRRTK